MTQFFNSSSSTLGSEKQRSFGQPVSANKPITGASQRIKSFLRIGSSSQPAKEKESKSNESAATPKSDLKNSIRSSRFIPHLGRNRSQTVASEGNPFDDHTSPTLHANPYFQYQGPPALRHHNDTSVPPSPPDTPQNSNRTDGISGANDQQTLANREELARKLRRVASAPNAQGLFSSSKSKDQPPNADGTPSQDGLTQHGNASALSVLETAPASSNHLSPPPLAGIPSPGQIRNSVAFRRTYSSNSIKMRAVEVGPGSFDKIKMIGKGDVGKVYLVREKKSSRLYAMKGMRCSISQV